MMLTASDRRRRFLAKSVFAGVLLVATAATAAASQTGRATWSDQVWNAALQQRPQKVLDLFAHAPDAGRTESFNAALAKYNANLAKAEDVRNESRETALTEMRTAISEKDLSLALRSAVEVQTLSDSYEDAFANADIQQIINWARTEIPKVEAERDWLRAQELLYRLRTLYDDTNHFAEYNDYDKQLDDVNRRVLLLGRYAPQRLHELRNEAAIRDGDEPLGEFNPGGIPHWSERLDEIDARMLKEALRRAAREHIESQGWQPLLLGGLDALQLVSTTQSLAETFPRIGDPEAVDRWNAQIGHYADRVMREDNDELTSWTLSDLLDNLVRLNEQTLQLPREMIYREFGDGAMHELDPFSEIIWPEKIRRFQQATMGNFVGVGILIRQNEKNEVMVVSPLEGTPAYFAGMKPDDLIMAVDGKSTVGWTLNEAVDRITGPQNETVVLSVKREGEQDLIDIPIVRDVIKLRSVKGWWKEGLDADGNPQWDWWVDEANRIAYIRLTQFTNDTYADLLNAWRELSDEAKPNGLVLDLRFNPGGLLTSAVDISNLFVKQTGVIVSGEDKNGRTTWQLDASPRRALLSEVPTVVLINKGSASASEIVSGCVQAYGAGVVIGERSFGKGSVQTVPEIAKNAQLKITTQYYRLPPNQKTGERVGRLVHKRPNATDWGVNPDIEVKMTPDQVVGSIELRQEADIIPEDEDGNLDPDSADRPDIDRLLVEGLDPQLETALLLLQARTLQVEDQGSIRKASIN